MRVHSGTDQDGYKRQGLPRRPRAKSESRDQRRGRLGRLHLARASHIKASLDGCENTVSLTNDWPCARQAARRASAQARAWAECSSGSVMCCRARASCRSAFTNSASDGNKPEASAERYKVDLPAPLGPASKKKTGFKNGKRSGGLHHLAAVALHGLGQTAGTFRG